MKGVGNKMMETPRMKNAILLIVFGLTWLTASPSHLIAEGQLPPASAAKVLPEPMVTQTRQTNQIGGAVEGASIITLPFWQDVEEPEPDRTQPIYRVYKRGWPVEVTADLQWFIRDLAEEHDFCERIIFGTILAESTFRADAIGDRGRSFGLAQINRFWITRANINRLDDYWQSRDLLCPYDNLTTMMELWLHARERYSLDTSQDLDMKRLLFWHNTGNDPRRVTYWNYSNRIFSYAAELVLIEQQIDLSQPL